MGGRGGLTHADPGDSVFLERNKMIFWGGLRSGEWERANLISGHGRGVQQLVFAPTYRRFIADAFVPDKWQRDLSEDFRKRTWQLLCRDCGQHFGGTTRGVHKPLTTAQLSKWAKEADALGPKMVDIENAPKLRMKVLRLLLIGGLVTSEREHRHRKLSGKTVCSCGAAEPSIERISWECA